MKKKIDDMFTNVLIIIMLNLFFFYNMSIIEIKEEHIVPLQWCSALIIFLSIGILLADTITIAIIANKQIKK